jgi:ESX-1-secreted protein regulator
MTAAHINQLVNEQATAPTDPLLEALASFFGVPVTYFFDDHAVRINDQITLVKAWRDTEVRHIAERVVELKPRDRNTVTNLIEDLRAYDQQSTRPAADSRGQELNAPPPPVGGFRHRWFRR